MNSSFPLDEYEFGHDLVQTFLEDQNSLLERLNELSLEIEAEEESIGALYSSIDDDYVQSLKKTLGLTEITGEGVEIILDDSPTISRDDIIIDPNSLIYAADLRDLVNLLRTFPFEALVINGQRVVSKSPITSAGSSILVNNFNLTPPFKIEMVTELPDLVIQKLTLEQELPSLYSRVSTTGIQFKFKKQEDMTLPAYIGGYSTDYLTPIQ